MSGVRVRKRRSRTPRLRVVNGWVAALEEADAAVRQDGATTYLHRSDCTSAVGMCDCLIVQIGPSVRGLPA